MVAVAAGVGPGSRMIGSHVPEIHRDREPQVRGTALRGERLIEGAALTDSEIVALGRLI